MLVRTLRTVPLPGWYYLDSQVIDPAFDDDNGDLGWIQQQIESTGSIAMHPDGDSRPTTFDPVPLCSQAYDDEMVFPRSTEWTQYLKDRERWEREKEEVEARWGRHQQEIEQHLSAPPTEPAKYFAPVEKPEPPPTPLGFVLAKMRFDEALEPGTGRVWQSWVMVNACDAPQCRDKWAEVWRGRGMVIFRMGMVGAF